MVSDYIGRGLPTKTTNNNEMYNEVVNQEDFEYMEETGANKSKNNETFQIDWIIIYELQIVYFTYNTYN